MPNVKKQNKPSHYEYNFDDDIAVYVDNETDSIQPDNADDNPLYDIPPGNDNASDNPTKDKYIIKLDGENNDNGGNDDNNGLKLILAHNDSIITLLDIQPEIENYKLYNFSHSKPVSGKYTFIYETELSDTNIFNIFIYLLSHIIYKNIKGGKRAITYDTLKKNFDESYKKFIEYNKSSYDNKSTDDNKLYFPTIIKKDYFDKGFLDICSKLIKKPKPEKKTEGERTVVKMRSIKGRQTVGNLCMGNQSGVFSLCYSPPSYPGTPPPAYTNNDENIGNGNLPPADISSSDIMDWITKWGEEIEINIKNIHFIDIFDKNYIAIFQNKIINILNGNSSGETDNNSLSGQHSINGEDEETNDIKPPSNCEATFKQATMCIWFNKEAHSNQTCRCRGSIRQDDPLNNSKTNNLLQNAEKEMIKNEKCKELLLLLWSTCIINKPVTNIADDNNSPAVSKGKEIEILKPIKDVLKDKTFITDTKQVKEIINKFLEKYKDNCENEVKSFIQNLFDEKAQATTENEIVKTTPETIPQGGFYKMDNVEKSVKQNKIKLTEKKKIKLKKLLEIRNIYTNKEKYYKNKKIKKNKFNENIIFFKNRNKLTITFTNYIFEKFLIPIKHFNIYMKKNKKIDIIEQKIKDFENKYDLQKVTRDNNEKLMEFFLKKKNLEKEKNIIMKRLEVNKKAPNEFINQELNLLNEKRKQILELEEKSIRENPEIKEYYLEKMNYNKNIKIIQNHYDKLQERIKKYKSYYKIIENKKNKFYTINNLNITYLQYIKNEIEIFNLFNIELDTKMKKEFKKNIKNTYIFYYILKKKFTTFLTKLNKKKFIINEEFKNLYTEKNDLNKKFDKSVYIKDKEEILELLRKINFKIYYLKLIYYNLNLIIELIEDINIKSEYMLFIIEYFLSYLNNYEKVCNILNLIVDKDILYQYLEKDTMELNKITKKNISYKDFLKILNNIKNNNKYIYNNRKRLLGKKNTINTKYHTIITETFNLANDIKKKVVIKNEEKYEMEKQEKIKELREKEREKLKYEDFLNNLINLNADYLLILNPILLLVKVEYLNFNNNKLTINKKTLNKIPNNKTIKKKLKRLNILEKRINVFNESNNIKPFVIKYPQNPLN